jgi:hypothetical protein
VKPPDISVGTPEEYSHWVSELRKLLSEIGRDPGTLQQVDARYHYKDNRVTLYRLADPSNPLSIADTISHELLHALLYQMEEGHAARAIDWVGKPVGDPGRVGGI